jgi:hypothetical protein
MPVLVVLIGFAAHLAIVTEQKSSQKKSALAQPREIRTNNGRICSFRLART